LVVAVLNVMMSGALRDGRPEVFDVPLPVIPLLVVIASLTDGLGEELGWRGFALPRMLEGRNAFVISLVLGLIWAAWHLPLFWTEGAGREGTPVWILFAQLPATAVIYTWLFQHTQGSVVAAALLHGSFNVFAVVPPGPGEPLTPALIALGIHWLLAAGLTTLAGSRGLDRWPGQAATGASSS
jgi:membrane protease YdiL (CAAX protease family)